MKTRIPILITLLGGLLETNAQTNFTQVDSAAIRDIFNGGGVAWVDYDNDGFVDLCVASFGGNNYLLHNQHDGTFVAVTDGPETDGTPTSGFLYHNNGDGTFTRITNGPIAEFLSSTGGCGWGHYDNDGFLDLFISNLFIPTVDATGPAESGLFHNTGNSNHWLKIKCEGTASNRMGIGAKVRVKATIGGKIFWQLREITSGDGFGNAAFIAHFGLGDATNIDTVRIEWPSGTVQEFKDVTVKQILTISELLSVPAAPIGGKVVAWGGASRVETKIPPNLTNVIAIASGAEHALALRADGTVIDWGLGDHAFAGPGFTNVVAISAGGGGVARLRSLSLKSDGTVAERVEASNAEVVLPPGLSNIVAIACGSEHSLVLKADGTVVEWAHQDGSVGGSQTFNSFSGTLLPVPEGLSNVVAIAAGYHSLALKSDGNVVTWSHGGHPHAAFNTGVTNVPPNLSNVVAIAAGEYHSLALQSDGTVVAWGEYGYDWGGFPEWSFGLVTVPSDLTNVVALAGGTYQSLALKADGTVVTWGPENRTNGDGVVLVLTNPPPELTNGIAIAGSLATPFSNLTREHALALVGIGPPVLQAKIATLKQEPHGFSCSIPSQSGKVFRLEYKDSLADREWTPLPLVAGNGTLTDSTATDSQRFYRVRRW